MSIQKRGNGYQYRWRDESGRQRSKQFRTKGSAEKFHQQRLERDKDENPDMRLDAFIQNDWWPQQRRDLAPKTISFYEYLINRYILLWLGRHTLGELTLRRVTHFRTQLEDDGVAASLVMRSLRLLGQILEEAVRYGYITRNPVEKVRKPKLPKRRGVRVLSVEAVEAVRMRMEPRDATLVSVLAYAGLRPGEALALTWGDVRNNSIVVDKALSLGQVQSTKTGVNRSVPLLSPLRDDLDFWYANRWDDELIFPSHAGKPWGQTTWANWRKRILQPTFLELGLEGVPYELRHTYVSLRINEGSDIARVARDAGHNVWTCSHTYIHVIEDYDEAQRVPAETRIWGVRKMLTSGESSQLSQNGNSSY